MKQLKEDCRNALKKEKIIMEGSPESGVRLASKETQSRCKHICLHSASGGTMSHRTELAQHGTLSCQKASLMLPDLLVISREANKSDFM